MSSSDTPTLIYTPRNDWVVLRKRLVTKLGNIAVSERSAQACQFFVVASGPCVQGLGPGDRVIITASPGEDDFFELPRDRDLIVLREKHISLIVTEVNPPGEGPPARVCPYEEVSQ